MPLTRPQKEKQVEGLTEKIAKDKLVLFTNYKGLTVKDISTLRKNLKKSGGAYKVVKKTFLGIALKNNGMDINPETLDGQIGIAFSSGIEPGVAKSLYLFSKEKGALRILGGFLEKKNLSREEVLEFAKLPGREELLENVVGGIAAPLTGFVGVLRANLRNFVYALKAIEQTKS